MKYSFTCQPDGQVLSVEAKNDDEGLKKLLVVNKKHMKEFHKDLPPQTDEEMKKFIRSIWKKQA
jgi:hypothetical protein